MLMWTVHGDEFSASVLFLPPLDTVAFRPGRLSRVSPVARRTSPLSGSDTSLPVCATALARTHEAETIAQRIAQSASATRTAARDRLRHSVTQLEAKGRLHSLVASLL